PEGICRPGTCRRHAPRRRDSTVSPKGPTMRTRWLIVTMVLILLAFGAGVFVPRTWLPVSQMQENPAPASKKARYQCAMHPQIVSDHPDVCPICQMKLQRVDEGEAP